MRKSMRELRLKIIIQGKRKGKKKRQGGRGREKRSKMKGKRKGNQSRELISPNCLVFCLIRLTVVEVDSARICEHLWSPGIDSASLCCLAGRYEKRVVLPARQAGSRFLGSLKGLQILTLAAGPPVFYF